MSFYGVIPVKLDETKLLDRKYAGNLIQWYFHYIPQWKLYMVPQIQKKITPGTQNLCQRQISYFEITVFF